MPWFASSRTTNQNMVRGDTNHGLESCKGGAIAFMKYMIFLFLQFLPVVFLYAENVTLYVLSSGEGAR